jgi:hypothetical protein
MNLAENTINSYRQMLLKQTGTKTVLENKKILTRTAIIGIKYYKIAVFK